MQRINTSDGKFRDGDDSTGEQGTIVTAALMEALQEEIAGTVEGVGMTLDAADNGQLLKAITSIIYRIAPLADTGAANAYKATNIVPLTAETLVHGVRQRVTLAATNNGASTFAPDGLPPKPIIGLNLAALSGGELVASQVADFEYVVNAAINEANGAWLLVRCGGGKIQLPSGSYGTTPGQFDNSMKLVNSAFVSSMLGNLGTASNVSVTAFPYNVTAAKMGSMLAVNGAGTVNLPNASSFPAGVTVMFYAAYSFTLAASSGQGLVPYAGAASVTSMVIPAISTVSATWNGAGWLVTISGAASASIGSGAGEYIKIPTVQGRPMIVQCGSFVGSTSGDTPVTFPIAFPNGFRMAVVSGLCSGTGAWGGYNSPTLTGMNCNWWSASGTRQSGSGTYIAIGD